jgi:hypothetical protein
VVRCVRRKRAARTCTAAQAQDRASHAEGRPTAEHFFRWFHHFRWIVLQRYGVVHSISDPEMLISDILTKCFTSAPRAFVVPNYLTELASNRCLLLEDLISSGAAESQKQ